MHIHNTKLIQLPIQMINMAYCLLKCYTKNVTYENIKRVKILFKNYQNSFTLQLHYTNLHLF